MRQSASTYDANGNLNGQSGWTYTYDAQNRLLSATSATLAVQFQYDARNRCVARSINGTVTYLIYDNWNLIEERAATGTLLDKYIHGANVDEILVRYNGGAIYYHHDGLGSVTHLTDATGALVESYQYDVYGAVTILAPDSSILTSSAVGNRFLFTGREWLPEVGLYDYRNRFYSPSLGRFLQTDPIGFGAGDMNIYRYVWNEPVGFVDPSGLTDESPQAPQSGATRTVNPPRGGPVNPTSNLPVVNQNYNSLSTDVPSARANAVITALQKGASLLDARMYSRLYNQALSSCQAVAHSQQGLRIGVDCNEVV